MTDTPRTDARLHGDFPYLVDADFARQLERELNEAKSLESTFVKAVELERDQCNDNFARNEAWILKACGKSVMSYPAINGVMELVKDLNQWREMARKLALWLNNSHGKYLPDEHPDCQYCKAIAHFNELKGKL